MTQRNHDETNNSTHVAFEFARDWQHAGIAYQAGDRARLAAATASMLANMGAGAIAPPVRKKRRDDTLDQDRVANSGHDNSNSED